MNPSQYTFENGLFSKELLDNTENNFIGFQKYVSKRINGDTRINGETVEVHLSTVDYDSSIAFPTKNKDLAGILKIASWGHDFIEDYKIGLSTKVALNKLRIFFQNIELFDKSLPIIDSLTKDSSKKLRNQEIQKNSINDLVIGDLRIPADYLLKPFRVLGNLPLRYRNDNNQKGFLELYQKVLAAVLATCDSKSNFDPFEYIHEGNLESRVIKALNEGKTDPIKDYFPSDKREGLIKLIRKLKDSEIPEFTFNVSNSAKKKIETNKKRNSLRNIVLTPMYEKVVQSSNAIYQGEEVVTREIRDAFTQYVVGLYDMSIEYLASHKKNFDFDLFINYAVEKNFQTLESRLRHLKPKKIIV